MSVVGHRAGYLLKKWLWCSWRHRQERCYPVVWIPDSNLWHCMKCHPCGEALDALLEF